MPIPGLKSPITDPRIMSSILATEDLERKRLADDQRAESAAAVIKGHALANREAGRKAAETTIAADALEWAKDPTYAGKDYFSATRDHPEVGRHFGRDVYGDAAAAAPKAWNTAQREATNTPAGMLKIPGLAENQTAVADEKGGLTISTTGAPRTGITFKSPQAAIEAGYGLEGAEALPDGGVHITKMSRADKTTPAQKAIDTKYATDFVEWETGGASDVTKSLAQLTDAKKRLMGGKNISGPWLGDMPDFVLSKTAPEAIAVREAIAEVVQRNLRAILGGQFAQREGEQLIKRAFNPSLPEQENVLRLNRLMTQIALAAEAKNSAAKFFRENGTLTGWQGKLPSISDFNPEAETPGTGKPAAGTPPAPAAPAAPAGPKNTVPMTSPEGDIYYIPLENVEKARAKGFK